VIRRPLLTVLGAFTLVSLSLEAGSQATTLCFEVDVAEGLLPRPTAGRVLVVLSKDVGSPPRLRLGRTGLDSPPVLGADAEAFRPGQTVVLDRNSALFPLMDLAALPSGEYSVQAIFDYNRDLRFPNAPENLISEPRRVWIDPAKGGIVRLTLTRKLPAETLPPPTENIRYVRLRSERLSRFHGRDIYLRAGVLLPIGHAKELDRRYPLRVHIGGFGTRYTAVSRLLEADAEFRQAWMAPDAPRMILLHLDGAGPLGDPYQVNSANHGPYGDAITQELIPYVEKVYRGIGTPSSRVLDGASTGGWVSLALQIFYPDFFNGCWSHAPDPVDFRAFELIDIYSDANAYVNRAGFERPAARTLNGDVEYTVRHEVQLERVLGRGNRWTLSGRDWASWNATFGPRGKDGLPVPLWDGLTGKIDPQVAEHYRKYDLRLHLQQNWATLGPKLAGKIRIWVGEADEYFLNNAVHLLDDFLKTARPAFQGKITFAPRQGHSWSGISDREMLRQMAAVTGAKP
jgi:hypothetical protein